MSEDTLCKDQMSGDALCKGQMSEDGLCKDQMSDILFQEQVSKDALRTR